MVGRADKRSQLNTDCVYKDMSCTDIAFTGIHSQVCHTQICHVQVFQSMEILNKQGLHDPSFGLLERPGLHFSSIPQAFF